MSKLLSIFLCMCLLCTILPMSVFAEEEEGDYVIPGTEDIAQEEAGPAAGSAVIIENVVIQSAAPEGTQQSESTQPDGENPQQSSVEVNNLDALLDGDEEPEDLTYVNSFPAVVQTQVYDGSGVINQSLQSPYKEPATGQGSTTVSDLYQVKDGAVPISNDIVIKGSTETITPPEDVQEQLANTPFGALQRNDNNTVQDTTDDTYVRSRETKADNAINRAIQDALNRATSDSTYITILVAEGEYDGDIIVNATNDQLQDGFKIYVLTEDSYETPAEGEIIDKETVGAQGEGGAVVNGNVTVNAAKNFELIMAGLYLSVNSIVEAKGKASVTVHGTQEDDTITYTQSGEGNGSIRTGDGNDTVNATYGAEGVLLIDGGEGADDLAVSLSGNEKAAVTINGGADDDTIALSAEKASGQKASVTVNAGTGADNVNVDLNAANAVSQLNVYGEEDYDILTLSGEISSEATNTVTETPYYGEDGQSVVDYDFVIRAASKAGQLITINAFRLNALADGITNKPKQYITGEHLSQDQIVVSSSFTNYVIADADVLNAMMHEDVVLCAAEGQKLYFAKLIIEGDELTIGNLQVSGLDLEINGKQITINGNISADSIIINATDDDSYALSDPSGLGKSSMSDADTTLNLDFWNFDLATEASIRIAENAVLNARNNILLSATSTQTQPIFNFDLGLIEISFPLVVKVGLADIGIEGNLTAGGKVEATSSTKVEVKTNNEFFQRFRLPVSVVVVVADAHTDVTSTGVIQSGSSTKLSSKAEVTTSSIATIGVIPISLALSVVSLDVGTTVDGTITAGGSIDLLAEAFSNVTTRSQEDPPKDMLLVHNTTGNAGTSVAPPPPPANGSFSFGGFFAVAVVLQDCRALVTDRAKLTAAADINISSKSIEKARTIAQASMNNAAGQTQAMDLNSVTGVMTGILGMVQGNSHNNILSAVALNKLNTLLNKGIDQIAGGSLTINVENPINGTVTTPQKSNPGDTVTVRALPDSGYTIDMASIGYTDQTDGQYKVMEIITKTGEGRPTSTDFTFKMPNASVKLIVTFRKLNEGEKPLPQGTGAIDSRAGVTGSVDAANKGASDSFVAPEYPTQAGKDVYEITAAPVAQINNVAPGTVSLHTKYAKNGQKVLVDIKPAKGYEVDKLLIEKTMGEGTDKRTVTEEVAADDNGQYIFTMASGNAKVTATFRKSNSNNSQTQSSSMGTTGTARKNSGQLVGSVAVAFVDNDNQADISVGGEGFVKAGGSVNLRADASTQSESLADASPIDRDPKSTTNVYVNDGSSTLQDQVTAEKIRNYGDNAAKPDFTVVYGQMTNGYTSEEKYTVKVGYENVTFNVNPRDGYYINKVYYTYVTQKGSGTAAEQVSPEVILYQYTKGAPVLDTFQTFILTSQKPAAGQNDPTHLGDNWNNGKLYVYAEFAPHVYTVKKNESDGKSEYSYQISGGNGTAADGNVQARSGSTVVVHSIKKGTLNNGKYDYNIDQTSNDIKLIVTYTDRDGKLQNVDVTLNSTGGFSFIMPANDVTLKFAAKGVKMTVYDANAGTIPVTSTTSDLSIGQFQQTTDAAGNTVSVAKLEGTVDSKDKVVLNLSQKAYDNGKRLVITIEGYGLETANGQTLEKDLVLNIPVVSEGNGLFSFVMPDLTNSNTFDRKDGSGQLALAGIRIKYAFGADKDYKIVAEATTRPRVGATGTAPTTPNPNPNPGTGTTQKKLNVAETAGGMISVAPAADMGDIIYVTVTPYTGYRLVSNSLKITFKFDDGTDQTYTLGLDDNGVYKYALAENLPQGKKLINYYATTNEGPITITGEFASDQGGMRTSDAKSFSAGVGVDVAITKHSNEATISRGKVTAEGVTLSATTPEEITSYASSLAGYSAGDFGMAGAITVHVVSAKTYAQIREAADVSIGSGDLSLEAKSKTRITTIAEGSNPNGAAGAQAGVGAGIAVAVVGVDSVAEICENAALVQQEEAVLQKLNITAESENRETMDAKAGSAGGISVTPVLALTISSVTNEALLGRIRNNKLLRGLDGEVFAKSIIDRQVAANAAAAGESVGIGGSFAITVLNDTTRAKVRNSYKGDNLKVSTVGRSNLRSTSRAGSKGAAPSDAGSGSGDSSGSGSGSGSSPAAGTSDARANQAIGGASNLANTGNRGLSGNKVQTMSKNRNMAETEDEGSVQIAAGFNLNVQENVNESIIDDGIEVDLTGTLEVSAYNDTDAAVYANASAVGSKIGVGVGVAINIVSVANRAVIGLSKIHANSLYLTAEMYDDGSYARMLAAQAAKVDKGINILDFLIKTAIDERIDEAIASMDETSQEILGGMLYLLSDITASLVGQFSQTMLTHMGLEKLVSNDIETKFKNFADSFGKKVSDAAMGVLKNVLLTYVLNRLTALGTTPLDTVTNKMTGTVNIPGLPAPNPSKASGKTGSGNTGNGGNTTQNPGAMQKLMDKLSPEEKQTIGDLGPWPVSRWKTSQASCSVISLTLLS